MAIHFENYKTFSKGQGFVGVACRTKSPQASTQRWFACDCSACKLTLLNRRVVRIDGEDFGRVHEVYADRVLVARVNGDLLTVNLRDFDDEWIPAGGADANE